MWATILGVLNHWLTTSIALGITGWCILSALVNWLLWWKSADQWEKIAETKPVLGTILGLVKHWGIDPVGGLKAIQSYLNKMAGKNPLPEPPSADTSGEPTSSPNNHE